MNIKTVYEGIRRGDIPAFRVGKIYRIPRPTSIRCCATARPEVARLPKKKRRNP
jgi:hypothetical protein